MCPYTQGGWTTMASLRSRFRFLAPLKNQIDIRCDEVLQRSPALHSRYHAKHGRGAGITPDTKLVLEGYMSAANSFAREAFLVANPGVAMASHMHCAAPLLLAQERGIPALVL